MLTAETRVCATCRALVTDPTAATCVSCARALVPHHSTWPAPLKWWLAVEFVRSRFLPWKGSQETWEELLRDALNGTRAHPDRIERTRLQISQNTPAAELYPIALERAGLWRAAGSPIERPVVAAQEGAA